jgi:hypothetical protein
MYNKETLLLLRQDNHIVWRQIYSVIRNPTTSSHPSYLYYINFNIVLPSVLDFPSGLIVSDVLSSVVYLLWLLLFER